MDGMIVIDTWVSHTFLKATIYESMIILFVVSMGYMLSRLHVNIVITILLVIFTVIPSVQFVEEETDILKVGSDTYYRVAISNDLNITELSNKYIVVSSKGNT